MIITIDGPAGSGKSTAARKLAARLEVPYLDTGAMYRAVACAVLRAKVDPDDATAVARIVSTIRLDLDCGPTHTRVRIDGHDVTEAIRTMPVSAATSRIAPQPEVRKRLVEDQRRIGAKLGSFVTEGRDQGSVVFPNADAKFVLYASVEKRAERRFQEMTADGEDVTLQDVKNNIAARDGVDAKQWAPLLEQDRATLLDTANMTIATVVDELMRELQTRGLLSDNP
ncbi:MAG: (d)CMP kinase [Planctomycetes bacterium]|nr:(d)CMP kinase [Planctomycetota bacterium]MBI3834312.1 (d)CMP kinase [Planctomycetota bacterium]